LLTHLALLSRSLLQHWDCDCDLETSDVCPKCSIELVLDVANPSTDPEAEPITVTSRDIQIVTATPQGQEVARLFEVCNFSHKADEERAPYDTGIVIVKLGPGQRLCCTMTAKLGIGKVHAKYNPTATVAMRHEPEIRLNRDLLESVPRADKMSFVKQCTPGVFSYDKQSEQIVIEDAKKANNIDEIKKIGMIISKKMGFIENIVSCSFVPERFIFTIETSGALAPAQIVDSALSVLVKKLHDFGDVCGEIQKSATAAMAGYASTAAR
jgi:DNA-directed RNA polymerase II subunit RPB3